MKLSRISSLLLFFLFFSQLSMAQADEFIALKTNSEIVLDGNSNELIWGKCDWYPLKYVWIPYGQTITAGDFSGQFKVSWDEEFIYFLVVVTDDSLYDGHADPLVNYWDDDCVEVFLDEDNSGGNHQNNFNAFAYHVSTLLEAVDYSTTGPALFNNDVDVQYSKNGNIYTWELAIKIFDDSYVYGTNNTPVLLTHNKIIGFSMAYCDNDGSTNRENFIGSKYLPESQANNGYITADVFGNLTLIDTAIVSSTKNISSNDFIVYPTIVTDRLTINSSIASNEPVFFSIRNTTGSEIINNTFSASDGYSIDIENLQPGSYYIIARYTDKKVVRFFIKQ